VELQESSDLLMTPFERNLEAELILCYADVTAQQFSHSLSDLRNDRYSPSNQSCLSRLFCRAFANPASKSLKHIGLSADEADVFDRLPEYLYACVYGTAFTETYNLTDELVSIYILAESTSLNITQSSLYGSYRTSTVSRTSTAFAISQRIYTNTLSSA
jgi:hypothetical protein